jgi:hypothetical protein
MTAVPPLDRSTTDSAPHEPPPYHQPRALASMLPVSLTPLVDRVQELRLCACYSIDPRYGCSR